jgi:succinate---hydroxymethylglutarate CoA-transferase
MTDNVETGALHGLRVLDLTRILAGPLCTMMLGDMGADIIKVEPPNGDDTRTWGPPFIEGESAYYLGINRNKRSITLNMAEPSGRAVITALIAKSDVLVDNFKLGTLAKWGYTDAWFDEHAPRLVRCSISGYGSSGPKAAQPGYDFCLQAESGLMSISGQPDGAPTKYGVAIVDVCTGMLACNSILAALNARARTGRGQKVEVSLYESSLAMLVNVASNYLTTGKDARRFGNSHPSVVPYTTFTTADSMIALAVGNDAQFAKCAMVLGHPEWARDARYTLNRDRVANRDPLESMIATELKHDTTSAWITRLQAVGVPCGPINTVAQALDDPHTAARDMIETITHPTIGPLRMVGMPFKFSDTPASVRRAPPTQGQHSDEILRDVLGMDHAQVAALRRDKVVV